VILKALGDGGRSHEATWHSHSGLVSTYLTDFLLRGHEVDGKKCRNHQVCGDASVVKDKVEL